MSVSLGPFRFNAMVERETMFECFDFELKPAVDHCFTVEPISQYSLQDLAITVSDGGDAFPEFRHLVALRNNGALLLPEWKDFFWLAPRTIFWGSGGISPAQRRQFVSYLFFNERIWSIGFHSLRVKFCDKFRLFKTHIADE